MAKKKKRSKKPVQKAVRLKPDNFVKKRARLSPLYKCYINEDWQEGGMATIIITRKMRKGDLIVGSYVVDIFCLGIKDTFFSINLPEFQFEEDFLPLFKNNMNLDMEIIDATKAFNIIYGAVEYAEDLGFEPHKDFKITEYILADVETLEYMDIEFGKDGKPLYVPGPNDNITQILNTLKESVGEGNYEFGADLGGMFDDGFDADDEEYDDYEEVES